MASEDENSQHLPSLTSQDVKPKGTALRHLLQKKPFSGESESQRLQLRSQLKELIVSHYDQAVEADADVVLWKVVTYQLIGEYRRRIVLKTSLLEEDSTNARAAEELKRIISAFRRYLADSSLFYRGLISTIEEIHRLPRVRHALALTEGTAPDSLDDELLALQHTQRRAEQEHKCVVSCHRWLVVLGDLARYHRAIPGLGEEEKESYTAAAVRCYRAALFLDYNNGNPHNQLAVIASRDGNDLEQLYHYCRSLDCRDPFTTALENMRLVFKNNEERFTVIQRNQAQKKKGKLARKRAKGSNDSVNQTASALPPKLDKLSYFLLEFVRLHGILFSKSDIRELDTLRSATLKDYDTVLKRDLIDEKLLLQLIAVNIFACNNVSWHPEEPVKASTTKKPSPNVLKPALKFTVEFVQLTVNRALRAQNTSKFLAPVTAFFEWLVFHPQVIKRGNKQDRRGWTLLWKSSAQLFSTVAASRYICPEFTELMKLREGLPLLPEEVELRGFVHLEQAYANLPMVSSFSSVPSNLSRHDLVRAMRPTKLLSIAKALSSPPLSILVFEEEEGLFYYHYRQKAGGHDSSKESSTTKRAGGALVDASRGGKAKKLTKRALREQKMKSVSSEAHEKCESPQRRDEEEAAFQPGQGTVVTANSSGSHSAIGSGRKVDVPADEVGLSREEWFFGGMEVAAGPDAEAAAAAAAATSTSAVAAVLPYESDEERNAVTSPLTLFAPNHSKGGFGDIMRETTSADVQMVDIPFEDVASSDKGGPVTKNVWTSLISADPETPHSFFSGLVTQQTDSQPPALAQDSIWGWNGQSSVGPSSGWPDERVQSTNEAISKSSEATPYIDWNAHPYSSG